MESQVGSRHQFEYPTKFNKYRRMMERNSTPCNRVDNSEAPKEISHSTAAADMTAASSSSPTPPRAAGSIPLDIGPCTVGSAQQPGLNHSPPKKIFISRACDCQDAPLNLTTRSNQQKRDEDASSNRNNSTPNGIVESDNNSCSSSSNDNDDVEDNSGPEAMDVNSMSESMIIEDHFKRSLGRLYNACRGHVNASSNNNNNNNNNKNNNNSNHHHHNSSNGIDINNINNNNINSSSSSSNGVVVEEVNANKFNNSTPTLSNHFNFAMSALFSSPQFIPHSTAAAPSAASSASPTSFAVHPFVGLLTGSPAAIHDPQYHNLHHHANRFLHLQASAFPGNLLFNGHHLHPHHHPLQQQQQQQQHQHHQQQPQHHISTTTTTAATAADKLNKKSSSQAASSSSSSSLHHSSSFNAIRPHKSASPSSKTAGRHRFTPPDSYQPYPTDMKHRAEVLLEKTSVDAATTSVSGCVDDHFSKSLGEVWKKVKASNLSAELEELMPTSVDEHFAKALGDKWFKIKSDKIKTKPSSSSSSSSSSSDSPRKIPVAPPRNPNFFASPSSFVVRS